MQTRRNDAKYRNWKIAGDAKAALKELRESCMDTKITSIDEKRKKKLNSKKFSIKYQRRERELLNLSPQNIPDEFRSFYPPDTEDQIYTATEEAPFSGYKLLYEVDLSQALQAFNPVLLYRVMKMMYGDTDIVGAYINRKSTDNSKITVNVGTVDWSYSLQADQNIIKLLPIVKTKNKVF